MNINEVESCVIVNRKMKVKLKVSSTAFVDGGLIPSRYTCDGENISPDISWEGAPKETKSFLITTEDKDVPFKFLSLYTVVHWIVYNIPYNVTSLKGAVPKNKTLENGAKQGITTYKKAGYAGPCPPFGTHRYFFKVYALDTTIDLEPEEATRKNILNMIKGHIVGYGELVGRYKRK